MAEANKCLCNGPVDSLGRRSVRLETWVTSIGSGGKLEGELFASTQRRWDGLLLPEVTLTIMLASSAVRSADEKGWVTFRGD